MTSPTPDVSQADVEELCKQLRNAHDLIETLSLANAALRKERDDATFEMQERATTLAGHLDAMADLVAEIAALRERAEKAEQGRTMFLDDPPEPTRETYTDTETLHVRR